MCNSNIAPPSPSEEVGFIARLIPNCGVARIYRGVVRIFIAAFALAGVSLLWDVSADLRARHAWPVADGEIVSVSQQDSKGVPGSTTTDKHTRYWGGIRSEICRAGRSMQDRHNLWGRTRSHTLPGNRRTRTTRVLRRHSLRMAEPCCSEETRRQILHDPNGPGIKDRRRISLAYISLGHDLSTDRDFGVF